MNITMTGACLATRLLTVAVVSGVSMSAQAALSCPFADGNGLEAGACIAGQGTWQTSLLPRDWDGNGVGVDAYYDPFLDITWLKNANLARTSGHDGDGRMDFSSANAWAAGLTLFGGNEWRLPTLAPVNSSTFNTAFSNNGSTDVGSARTGEGWGRHSEMGYMYYVHLGNRGQFVPDDADPGSWVVQPGWGLANTGPFRNLLAEWYWTDEAFESYHSLHRWQGWDFGFGDGRQEYLDQHNSQLAWAVHPGDLLIPVPGALWLLGSALLTVGARVRRR